jgi:hypothetical protein
MVTQYGLRAAQPSKLDVFKPYLEERLRAGVFSPSGRRWLQFRAKFLL